MIMKKLIMGLAVASLILAPMAQADDDVLPDLDHLTATPWDVFDYPAGLQLETRYVPESLFVGDSPDQVYPDLANVH
jgi:hypothetical protein